MEAVACEPAISAATNSEMASDLDETPENDAQGSQSEQHALCAHGHCHHGPQTLTDIAPASQFQAVSEVGSSHRDDRLAPRIADTLKRPPRA